jgi:hypothetical protein
MQKQVKCALCAEELIAPEWSGYANAQAVRNFWHCTNCGYVFESLDRKTSLQIECVQEFLTAA